MKKITLSELESKALKKEWQRAVIVFSEDSFNEIYTLESRSYEIWSSDNYFDYKKISKSLYGTSLDKSDCNVRLDLYLKDWTIDYCYILD